MRGFDWDDLKVLLAVADERSVRNAAAVLGIHHSTVTRRLDQFEERLEVLLFDRTPGGLRINDHGSSVVEHGRRIAREMESLERNFGGLDQRLTGDIRLTLPDVMASHLLSADLARFCAGHPDITVELIPTHAALDIARRDADIAVRVTDSPPEHLVGRSLGRYSVAAYARRDAPMPGTWIGTRGDDVRDATWRAQFCPGATVVMRCDGALARLGAVQAGTGASMLPCGLADLQPELVRLPPAVPVDAGEIWMLTHPDLRSAARVRALMGCLKEAFDRHRDALLGLRSREVA